LDDLRLVDAELNATEWRTTLVEKAACAVENTAANGWPGEERKDGGRRRWSAVEREDGGRSGAVESVVAVWSRWSTPRWCGHEGAVNEE
jgi:hypothetical protein